LDLSDRSYEFSASVIALRKWSYWCPFCWASLPQRSQLDSGAAGGGAVTYCCRSLSCDGHSLALCGCLCLLVARNIGLVRVHVCRAKRCVLRTDGHEPFSFLKLGALYALAVPDSFSLRRRFYLRSIVRCVLNLLGSICIAFLVSVLSSKETAVAVCAQSLCCAGLTLDLCLCFTRARCAGCSCLLIARRVGLESCTAAECAFLCLGSEPFGC
jgi:hypothetical protein